MKVLFPPCISVNCLGTHWDTAPALGTNWCTPEIMAAWAEIPQCRSREDHLLRKETLRRDGV